MIRSQLTLGMVVWASMGSGAWNCGLPVNAQEPKQQRSFYAPSAIMSLAYSPNGNTIARGDFEGRVRLWDVVSGTATGVLEQRKSRVTALTFSPDGKFLAAGCSDSAIRIWELATGKTTTTLTGLKLNVLAAAFRPDGKSVIGGNMSGIIKTWDVATGGDISTVKGKAGISIAFSRDGKKAAIGNVKKTIQVLDLATGAEMAVLIGHGSSVSCVAFSPNGDMLASGDQGTVSVKFPETKALPSFRLWDLATGKNVATISGGNSRIRCVAFSPGGKRVAYGYEAGTVKLVDVASGKVTATFEGDSMSFVAGVAFSPNGKTLATGGRDGQIRLWELQPER